MNKYDHQLTKPHLRNALVHRVGRYYHTYAIGRALGYYRPRTLPGVWCARIHRGAKIYQRHCLGFADDVQDANGTNVITFDRALAKAKEWCARPEQSNFSPGPKPTGPIKELIACPCGPVYTVGHALAEYVEWKRTFAAKSTFQALLPMLNIYVYPRLGTIPVVDLAADDIRHLMEYVVSTPTMAYFRRYGFSFNPAIMDAETRRRRRNTANHVLSILKGALNLAWEQGKIADDRPWRRVPNFKAVRRARIDFLTRDECRDLIVACNPVFRPIVMALLYTGCRISELMDLQAEDVSRVRMAVHIKKSKFYSSRHISLPEEGYSFFKSLSFGKDRQTLLFLRPSGEPWTRHFLCKELKWALARADLSNGLVFHTLRHTYASLRLQEGVSPVAVARQMGHRDVRTVLQIYAHCTDDFIDEEIRKRFTPIIEGDPVLTSLFESDGGAVAMLDDSAKQAQAASPWRTAR